MSRCSGANAAVTRPWGGPGSPPQCHCLRLSRFGCLCLLIHILPDWLPLRLARFNRDLAALALRFRDGNSHFQDAIVELGFGLVGFGAFGEGNFAIEGSVGALGAVDSAALLLPFAFSLS